MDLRRGYKDVMWEFILSRNNNALCISCNCVDYYLYIATHDCTGFPYAFFMQQMVIGIASLCRTWHNIRTLQIAARTQELGEHYE